MYASSPQPQAVAEKLFKWECIMTKAGHQDLFWGRNKGRELSRAPDCSGTVTVSVPKGFVCKLVHLEL